MVFHGGEREVRWVIAGTGAAPGRSVNEASLLRGTVTAAAEGREGGGKQACVGRVS